MGFVGNYVRNLAGICLGREPLRPLMFSYYLTHRCNLNCRYCCDGDGKRFNEDRIPELNTNDVKRLLAVLREAGDTLDVTGGEPMLRDDLEEILAYARSLRFRTVLNTKGIGIADRPRILEFTDVLVLSLDTLNPTLLAELLGRPEATARQVLAALEFALSFRRNREIKIVLSAVATPDNIDEVRQSLDFALRNSCGFQISPEIVGTTVHPDLRDNASYRKLMEDVIEAKRNRRGVLGVPDYLLGVADFRRFRCHPMLMPVIRPDGRMYYPCLEWKQAEINLLETGDYFESLRLARMRFGEIPKCQDCCHIFCHMALSLLQRRPISALGELKHWSF